MHGNKSNYQEPSMSGTQKYVQRIESNFEHETIPRDYTLSSRRD